MRRWNHLLADASAAQALSSYGDAVWRAAAALVGEAELGPATLPEEITA